MRAEDLAGESILIAAGGRSILLQLADPGIGHGVADHSDFVSRPLDRLNGTLSFVYAVACGTRAEAAYAIARVNRAHGPVRSAGSPAEPAYNAFNPALQLWVAATLYDSAVTMYEMMYGPLSDEVADDMYERYQALGTALQVPRELWPTTRADFARYWQQRLGELRTDAATRAVAHQLLYPSRGPFWLRLAMPLGRLVTVGLLPPPVRTLFELPWSPRSQRGYQYLLRLLRVLYRPLPRRLRHLPKNHYLRQLRKSMAAGS